MKNFYEQNQYGSDVQKLYELIEHDDNITLEWHAITAKKMVRSGAFFPFYHTTKFNLSRYQIFTEMDDTTEADKDSCLIYALKQSGLVSETQLDELKLSMTMRETKARDLRTIAKTLNLTIQIQTPKTVSSKQRLITYNKGQPILSLGLIADHYFINQPTNITKYAIDEHDSVVDHISFPTVQRSTRASEHQKGLSSFQVISRLVESMTHLTPITLANVANKQTVDGLMDYEHLTEPVKRCDCSGTCTKGCKLNDYRPYWLSSEKKPFRGCFKNPRTDPNRNHELWFVDTETFIDPKVGYHVPYCLCASRYTVLPERVFTLEDCFDHHTFYGLDCVQQFLASLTTNAILYAHNMGFDFRTFVDHIDDLSAPIETGTKLKQVQGKYRFGDNYHHILFKDSMSFFPATPLSKLPGMFNLPCGDKEAFPHSLIRADNIYDHIPLDECLQHLKPELHQAFIDNATKHGMLKNGLVDIEAYATRYCSQDVNILGQAVIIFQKQIRKVCSIDIITMLSNPQLADEYLKAEHVYDGCYAISGIAQDFIRRCVVGGRVMSNSNQKYHIIANPGQELADFDAVSLYPSAMASMKGYLKGLPKVIKKENIDDWNSFRSSVDAYFVEIEVIDHKIDREFPLMSIKDRKGIRDFTNDIDGKRFYVDNIALDDLVEFQQASYRVIRGYYFDDGFNTQIVDSIRFMFNKRVELKAQKSPLETVYKLIMNASYGKLIQKPIRTQKTFVLSEDLSNYVSRNHKYIDGYTRINERLYCIKSKKSIIRHMTGCHIAAQILSTSKHLMNRVMCLAEDEGHKIWYQDTDSMHIAESSLSSLADAFEEKYGSALIGKNMGQFHSDFSVDDKRATDIKAIETIILGKKCYIDKLQYVDTNNHKKIDHHIRIKGIPGKAIIDFDDDVMGTYKRMYDGEALTFDLRQYIPLQIDTDYRARANTRCVSRTLSF